MTDLIRIEIADLQVDPITHMVVAVLKLVETGRVFPLWVGALEANAIGLELEGVKAPRPMTHDLFKTTIEALDGVITHVALTALKDNTFYATVFIQRGDEQIRVDARPSDAFSLALRFQTPIYATPAVLSGITTFASMKVFWAERDTAIQRDGNLDPEDELN